MTLKERAKLVMKRDSNFSQQDLIDLFDYGADLGSKGKYDESYDYFNKLFKANDNFRYFLFLKIVEHLKNYQRDDGTFFNLFYTLDQDRRKVNEQLRINFKSEYERKLAHYTTTDVTNILLTNKPFRLNNIYNMNDPTEGEILSQYFKFKIDFNNDYKDVNYTPFVGCFTLNHDSLNQFRLYGKSAQKEVTGISLVFNKIFF